MRKSKFSEHQIIAILKAVEAGRTVRDVCREHEISKSLGHLTPREYLLTKKPEISSNSWVTSREAYILASWPKQPPVPAAVSR